jgi:AcrR family transcriptional regulator
MTESERPKSRRGDGARNQILKAAIEVFAEQGYSGAATREIAGRANVKLSLLSYYFGGKEGLWHACAQTILKGYAGRLNRIRAQGSGLDAKARLKILLREFAYEQAHYPRSRRFIHQSGIDSPPLSEEARLLLYAEWAAQLDMIREFQEAGVLPKGHEPTYLMPIITGAAANIFNGIYDPDMVASLKDERMFDAYMETVFATLGLN